MRGDEKIIEHLNRILKNELTAINQYFLHAKMLKNWGLTKLADITKKESIDEMRHADGLADRILYLEGLPNFQDMDRLNIGENVTETLKNDLQFEYRAIKDLKAAIQQCEISQDFASRDILEKILISEEEHIDFLETQLDLIDRVGLQNYQQSMM